MGAEIKGMISLLILNLSIATMVSGFIGGPAIVYLTPRNSIRKLILANGFWSLLSAGLVTSLLLWSELLTSIDASRFFRMAFAECLIVTNLMILLGKERIASHNVIQICKTAITVALLGAFLYFYESNFQLFIDAYEISLIISLILSSILILPYLGGGVKSSFFKTIKSSFSYGSIVQIGNLAQLLNYRIGYYVLEIIISPPQVALVRIGIFSATLQIAEALWQFTRSVNTVQYASMSNISDRTKGLVLSTKLVRLNYSVTGLGIIILLIIPSSLYIFILGEEFGEIKNHLFYLAPGIFALAFGGGINHFFAGMGQHRFNTYSSLIGLAISLALVYPFTFFLGTYGVALTTSIVYVFQAAIQCYFLKKTDQVQLDMFLLSQADIKELRSGLLSVWNRILR